MYCLFQVTRWRVYATKYLEAWKIFWIIFPGQKLHVQCPGVLKQLLRKWSIFSSSLLVRLWLRNWDEVDIKIKNKMQFRVNELNSFWTFGDFWQKMEGPQEMVQSFVNRQVLRADSWNKFHKSLVKMSVTTLLRLNHIRPKTTKGSSSSPQWVSYYVVSGFVGVFNR